MKKMHTNKEGVSALRLRGLKSLVGLASMSGSLGSRVGASGPGVLGTKTTSLNSCGGGKLESSGGGFDAVKFDESGSLGGDT